MSASDVTPPAAGGTDPAAQAAAQGAVAEAAPAVMQSSDPAMQAGDSSAAQGDTTLGGSVPTPPPVIDGGELYDTLMAQIEPELTRAGLATLRERYQSETPEQARARAKRYTAAFEAYEQRFAQQGVEWMAHFQRYKREALASIEKEVQVVEDRHADEVYQQIQTIDVSVPAASVTPAASAAPAAPAAETVNVSVTAEPAPAPQQ